MSKSNTLLVNAFRWSSVTAGLAFLGLAGASFLTGPTYEANDLAAGLSSIENVKFEDPAPLSVAHQTNEHWGWLEPSDDGQLASRTNCAGYQLTNGETWRFCEQLNASDGTSDYFWQDASSNRRSEAVSWN